MKKCAKTLTGKHEWTTKDFWIGLSGFNFYELPRPVCIHCEMVDDRKKKK